MKTLKISLLILMIIFCAGLVYAQTARDHYNKGIEYGVAGDFANAKVEFKKALGVDPNYESAKKCLNIIEDVTKQKIKKETAVHLFKGEVYYKKGKLDEAICEYKKALQINPNYAPAHNNLGNGYAEKGKLGEAIVEYKKAIELDPNYVYAHYNLGVTYDDKGKLDEAVVEYKEAIRIDPNFADAHTNLGLAYEDKGKLDEAIVEYKKAIKIDPNHAVAHNNLAIAYYSKKEYKLAILHCDKAIRLGYKVDPRFLKALEPYRK